MTSTLPDLQPGDVLLYYSGDFVDWLIGFRTWSHVSHVEVYLGDGVSTASRNGIGVGLYPLRTEGLRVVRRPVTPFNLDKAKALAQKMAGTPYGWTDLLMFYGIKRPCKGLICSQWGDIVEREAEVNAFAPDYPAGAVSPRDFLVTPGLTTVWQATE